MTSLPSITRDPEPTAAVCEDCGGLGQIKIDYCTYDEQGQPVPPIPCPAWKWVECESCDGTGEGQ
jgi:hypothetical protein